ncbi:MAG: aldo/keto reductase [Candidatus Rokubacteria bacterium]|nr:aldo/keto reductase [Candidatus Rokubacteria bacterium]
MGELISGRATPEGTAAYGQRMADRTAAGHFREHAGRWLSSLGLGTYLGEDDDPTDDLYRAAVVRALELGVNVLDSAINYRSQRSERVIGQALRLAFERRLVRREEVLVATKGGFLPFDGSRPRDPRRYVEETYIRPGIFTWEEFAAGCHCMAPRYLADQLERSRRNLGLAAIDVYHVHNPETQLAEVSREEFMRRIRAAFEVLEAACAEGKIGVYGTATWNGYRQPREAPDYLSLADLVGVAREVGGAGHHFRVLQFPYNLAMLEAFGLANQRLDGREAPLLEAARAHGLYVMTSASILQGRLARNLPAALRDSLGGFDTDAQRAIQFVRSTPGVGTALVGMKRVGHVEENARIAQVPPVPEETLQALFR